MRVRFSLRGSGFRALGFRTGLGLWGFRVLSTVTVFVIYGPFGQMLSFSTAVKQLQLFYMPASRKSLGSGFRGRIGCGSL